MDDLLNQRKPEKEEKPAPVPGNVLATPTENYLKEIASHLKSIRSMLQFFVVLIILGIVLQACSALGLM